MSHPRKASPRPCARRGTCRHATTPDIHHKSPYTTYGDYCMSAGVVIRTLRTARRAASTPSPRRSGGGGLSRSAAPIIHRYTHQPSELHRHLHTARFTGTRRLFMSPTSNCQFHVKLSVSCQIGGAPSRSCWMSPPAPRRRPDLDNNTRQQSPYNTYKDYCWVVWCVTPAGFGW